MKFLILLGFSIFCCISADNLTCYHTGSTDPTYKPLFNYAQGCSGLVKEKSVTQCFKQTVSESKNGLQKGVYYGCDLDNVCSGINNGKCESKDGVNTCCCGDNLCNSIGLRSFFTAATVITVTKMLF